MPIWRRKRREGEGEEEGTRQGKGGQGKEKVKEKEHIARIETQDVFLKGIVSLSSSFEENEDERMDITPSTSYESLFDVESARIITEKAQASSTIPAPKQAPAHTVFETGGVLEALGIDFVAIGSAAKEADVPLPNLVVRTQAGLTIGV